jgi:predicted transcriptional regulator
MTSRASASEGQREVALNKIFEKSQRTAIKKWMASQEDGPLDEIEAIRRLVELGLKKK